MFPGMVNVIACESCISCDPCTQSSIVPTFDMESFIALHRAPSVATISEPVGDHLHELLTKIGLQPTTTCQCEQRRVAMNSWGITGCREHREEIVGWLREAGSQLSYSQQFAAFAALASESWWSLTDPYGSLVDEAIRRAETPPL